MRWAYICVAPGTKNSPLLLTSFMYFSDDIVAAMAASTLADLERSRQVVGDRADFRDRRVDARKLIDILPTAAAPSNSQRDAPAIAVCDV